MKERTISFRAPKEVGEIIERARRKNKLTITALIINAIRKTYAGRRRTS